MSDTAATTRTPEDNRTFYNRRLREKRAKGHGLQMITEYVAQCPVPLDQLDLTDEERPEVERLRVEAEAAAEKRREDGSEIKDGLRVPAKIDFEAVKDIPVTDDIRRNSLARMNQLLRMYESNRFRGLDALFVDAIKQRAAAYYESDQSKHFLEHALMVYNEAMNAWKEVLDASHPYRFGECVVAELKRRATVSHGNDPSKSFLEHLWQVVEGSKGTDWQKLYNEHKAQEQARVDALKPESLEQCFDILAQHKIATVVYEFSAGQFSGSIDWDGCGVSEVTNTTGEEIDLEDGLPGDDGALGLALKEFIEEDGQETAGDHAIIGDADHPRYAYEGTYFQGSRGTITYDITNRRVSLEGTVNYEEISEQEDEVRETWELDKTKTAAA